MRVTNEQAKDIAETIYGEGQDMTKKNLAADLLEARELIKEMRELIERVMKSGFDTGCKCQNCATAHDILEKTKEYA